MHASLQNMPFENSSQQVVDSRENGDKTDLGGRYRRGSGRRQTGPYVGIVPILFDRLILQPRQNGSYL